MTHTLAAPTQHRTDPAAEFRAREPFTWRDITTLGVIGAFFIGIAVNFVISDPVVMTAYQFLMPAALATVLLIAYGPLLASHWRAFRARLGRNLLVVLGSVVALHVLLFLVRLPAGELFAKGPLTPRVEPIEAVDAAGLPLLLLTLLASFGPVLVAFVEDTVFRHTLLARIPVWERGIALRAAVVLINSMVFGAMHILAFGGNLLATVPYMVIGLAMNLLFLWTKNLWVVLGAHIAFNSLPILSTLFMVVMRATGAL